MRVDLDVNLPLAEEHDVMSIPTVLILRNGAEIARLDGLIAEADLAAAVGWAGMHGPPRQPRDPASPGPGSPPTLH